MSYHAVTQFAHIWGMITLLVLFLCAGLYALWPRNRDTFDHASRMPLEETDND